MKSTINKKVLGILVFLLLLIIGLFTYKAICPTDGLKVNTYQSGNGWGFDISHNEKVLIHQNIVPSITGSYSFKTKSDAIKTGNLMVKKMRNNEFPPSVSKEELKALGIEYLELNQRK